MVESKLHKKEKLKAAGKNGKTEVLLPSGKRLDAKSRNTATEIELSGNRKGIKKAVDRVIESNMKNKVLKVPNEDSDMAKKTSRKSNVKVKTIKK